MLLNLRRRHLDESQRAMVASKIANLGAGRPPKADGPGLFEETAPIEAVSQSAAADMLLARDEDGLTVVKYRNAVRPERLAAIEEREQARDRIDARVQDLREKEIFLAPFTPDDETTVEQAIQNMRRAGSAKPSTPAPAEPELAGELVTEEVAE